MKNYMIAGGRNLYGDRLLQVYDELMRDSLFGRNCAVRTNFAIDLRSEEGGYTIDADLPGVKKEEVSIELMDDLMTITVDKKEEENQENDNYIRRERRDLLTKRTFYLPDSDAEGVEAKLADGVLTVTIPKIKKADQTKTIEIQ